MRLEWIIGIAVMAVAAFVLVAGCGAVMGSGDLITLKEDYGEFSRIEADTAFDVEIRAGGTHEVAITVDDNLEEYLEVEVSGDTLKISMEDGNSYTDTTREAVVTMPELEEFSASDAVDASVSGFEGLSSLRIDLSDASELDGTGLTVDTLEVDASDASKVRLGGSGDTAELRASDASELDLLDFSLKEANVKLQDASNGTVTVTESLTADVSDASSLGYAGAPMVQDFDISDGSDIDTLD